MAKTINQRMTVNLEGDFVVFLIGMRINRFGSFTNGFLLPGQCQKCSSSYHRNRKAAFSAFKSLQDCRLLLFSIGNPSSTLRRMQKTEKGNTILRGKHSIPGLGVMAMLEFGMKHTK